MDQHIKREISSHAPDLRIARILIIIFFSVGITGMILPVTRNFFIILIPLALIISFLALALFHKPVNLKKELLAFSTIFIVSFAIEAVGVNTGRIFGTYSYGKGLGIKLFNTPFLIGLNWVMLVYCTSVIAERLKVHALLKILASSLLMVLYDIVMEQLAPEMRMWSFAGGVVPMANYISWFAIAFVFHSFLRVTDMKLINRIAGFIFAVQLSFFVFLGIFFKFLR
ncbi:MAG: carotenoid biosynthesis protein [Bacteroidales bacterium]|nr:carotenoid biosynthesis protein [Bacteroidales bacterium]